MCRDSLLIPGKKGFLSFYLGLLAMILLTRQARAFLESITRPRVWGERECMQGWKEGKGQLLQLEKREANSDLEIAKSDMFKEV